MRAEEIRRAFFTHETRAPGENKRQKEAERVRKRRGWIYMLLAICAAALTAAVWWRFARWGLARPAMRDAVFLRRIESILRKGEDFASGKDAGSEGI